MLFWSSSYETYINPVMLLQKRVIKAISFQKFTSSSTPIFSDLKILKLHDLFQWKLCFVYNCINQTSVSYFHSFFELVESVHPRSASVTTKLGNILKIQPMY